MLESILGCIVRFSCWKSKAVFNFNGRVELVSKLQEVVAVVCACVCAIIQSVVATTHTLNIYRKSLVKHI